MEGFRGNFVEICTACEIHSFHEELVKILPNNSLIARKSRPHRKNTVNIAFDLYSILVMLTKLSARMFNSNSKIKTFPKNVMSPKFILNG